MSQVTKRWDFRVSSETDNLVRRAAAQSERTLTDFVMATAILEAERLLADRRQFVLPPAKWARFIEILDRPPSENPGLKRLFSRASAFTQK